MTHVFFGYFSHKDLRHELLKYYYVRYAPLKLSTIMSRQSILSLLVAFTCFARLGLRIIRFHQGIPDVIILVTRFFSLRCNLGHRSSQPRMPHVVFLSINIHPCVVLAISFSGRTQLLIMVCNIWVCVTVSLPNYFWSTDAECRIRSEDLNAQITDHDS